MSKTKFEQVRDLFAEKQERNRSRNPMMGGSTKLDVIIGSNFGYEYGKNEERERSEKLKKDNEILLNAVKEIHADGSYTDIAAEIAREALKKIGES